MIKLSIKPVDLILKDRFTTFVDSRTVQQSHIITLQFEGLIGYGEVTSHPFYNTSREKILTDFGRIKSKFEGIKFEDPVVFWESLKPELKDNSFLLSGLDIAANDLYGKMNQKLLADLWKWNTDCLPVSSYTIGIDEQEVMLRKMQAMPWSSYKIKLGTKDDVGILKMLRQYTKVPFRIDANCAWDAEIIESMNGELEDLNIEFIEQAIHPANREEIKKAKAKSVFPIIADESFKDMHDLEFCAENYDGINIKLVKCGGLTPAKKIIQAAREKDLKIMVGCMTESSIAISAASQLVSKVDYVDLDGALLIENDTGEGTVIRSDKTLLGRSYGIGFKPFSFLKLS